MTVSECLSKHPEKEICTEMMYKIKLHMVKLLITFIYISSTFHSLNKILRSILHCLPMTKKVTKTLFSGLGFPIRVQENSVITRKFIE